MKKFIYRGTEFTGNIVEETETHYIVEIENDQVSLDKEVTLVEDIMKEETLTGIRWNKKTKEIKGEIIKTASNIYVIQRTGENGAIVHRFSNNLRWNRYWTIDTKTLKGAAGLPKQIIKLFKI